MRIPPLKSLLLLAVLALSANCQDFASCSNTPSCEATSSCGGKSQCESTQSEKTFKSEGPMVFAKKLFDTKDFPARWYCGNWSTDVGWLHIISDLGIFGAYFTIPVVLLFFLLRKKDIPFPKVIWLFASFILACGFGHLIEAGIFWWPAYRFAGIIKGFTAIISWVTVFALIWLVPMALRLPSAAILAGKLAKSQERLGIALEVAKVGVWELDLEKGLVTCDARTRKIYEIRSDSELVKRESFLTTIPPDDRQLVEAAIQAAVEQQRSFSIEHRVVCADGSVRFVQCFGKFVFDREASESKNSRRQLIGVCYDVTEAHHKNATLVANEQNLRATFESAALGIAHVSLNGHWLKVNPGLCSILGYTVAELVGTNTKAVTHPSDVDLDIVNQECVQGGTRESYSVEKRYIQKNGTVVWVNLTASLVRTIDGAPLHFVKVIEDITARKKAELELQNYHEQVEKLSLVASKTQHSVVISDAEGRVEWINDAFTRLTGFDLADVIGRKPSTFLQGEKTDPKSIALIRDSLKHRTSIAVELVNYHKDGSSYWIELKIDPVLNDSGVLTNFIATQIDITERKLNELSLRNAKKVAEEASQAKSDFLAAMSHELRTPLNGVIGMTELLADSNLDSRQRRFLGACKKSGQHLLTLINDILDFSKIEAGKFELDLHPFDLKQLLDDAAESMLQRVEAKGLKLLCRLHHPVSIYLVGDSHRLRQVIINLLGNAVKFTQEGLIMVDVEPLGITENRVSLRFRIKDTGIGIPEDQMQRLFKDFSQVDSSTSRRFGGTGLGLSISKSIVEAMGGQIGLKSIAGIGSEFWFELAFERVALEQSLVPIAPNEIIGLRVLVVDSNEETLRFLRDIFEAWGMKTDSFASLRAMQKELQSSDETAPYNILMFDPTLLESDESIKKLIASEARLEKVHVFCLKPQNVTSTTHQFETVSGIRKPLSSSQLLDAIVEIFCQKARNNSSLGGLHATENSGSNSSRRLRILLAEDNPTNQMFAQEILARQGWDCDVAVNGLEAIKAVEQNDYDLVLMDCQMPEMDGFSATEEIRAREKSGLKVGHTPIIALTANAIKGDRQRCLQSGMDEYLSKPFHPQSLTDMIQRFVSPENAIRLQAVAPVAKRASPSSNPIPPIDKRELVENRCMGDAAFALSLLDSFTSNCDTRMKEIFDHFRNANATGVGKAAHSLKGIAGIIAANRLSSLAAKMEYAGQANDLSSIEASLDELRAEVKSCCNFIQDYKNSEAPKLPTKTK
jgi:PAS domain S-box-containing protein